MSTNKRRHLRLGETLKNQYGPTKNKDGRDKCYVYINHITKISIISDTIKLLISQIMGTFIFFYKAGWSLHSKGCCSLSPTSLPHCPYKDRESKWHSQTIPHIYFTYTYEYYVDNLYTLCIPPFYLWHTPSPSFNGGPLPRILPLPDTMSGVKRGVNPSCRV